MSLKIIDAFSPNHFFILRLLENIAAFILDLIIHGKGKTEDLIIRIVSFILLILAALKYNEFLVINICKLRKYTKLFLDYEARKDFSSSLGIMGIDIDNVDEEDDDKSDSVDEIKSYIINNNNNNEIKDSE